LNDQSNKTEATYFKNTEEVYNNVTISVGIKVDRVPTLSSNQQSLLSPAAINQGRLERAFNAGVKSTMREIRRPSRAIVGGVKQDDGPGRAGPGRVF